MVWIRIRYRSIYTTIIELSMKDKFSLVRLPYSYDALEPSIDEKTMLVHYNVHYVGYLDKFNDLVHKNNIKGNAIDIMRNVDKYPIGVRDNGGGYVNHSLFWKMLKPYNDSANLPFGLSKKKIIQDFGSYTEFKKQILDQAKKRFGSGWVWWVMLPNGRTKIINTPYQDNPFMPEYNSYPLLGIDVWEHAYYLKYTAYREKYVKNIFKIINWSFINKRIEMAMG